MVKTIHPANIESELEHIWESLQGTNRMRASLFNLIIYTKKTQRNFYLNLIVKNVIKKFPSRIILITYDKDRKQQDLHTSASILSTEVGKNVIACDLIEIDLCKKYHPQIPFIIFPHVLPDLPIYLIYVDDLSKTNAIIRKLGLLANRMIFDSEAISDLTLFVRLMCKHNKESHTDIADLNWTRIEEWRQLFANIFHPPEELSRLKEATKIDIYYNSAKVPHIHHTNIQSIYLQAWIAVQLGWKCIMVSKKARCKKFFYNTLDLSIQISLHPSPLKTLPPGSILAIEITTKNHYHYSFKRSDTNLNHVIIKRWSPNYCLLPSCYILDEDTTKRALIQEICHKETSSHYMKTLHMLKKMGREQRGMCYE